MSKKIIIIGAGGHAKVLANAIKVCGSQIYGFVDNDFNKADKLILGGKVIGTDETVLSYKPDDILLVNGVGQIKESALRCSVYKKFKDLGYSFLSVIHASAVIAEDVKLAEGVQIMAGVVIQPGVSIGVNSIVNTRASIDHDCYIGAHVHIAPGVTLSGGVHLSDGVHAGTGTTVIQQVKIGPNSVLGAGSLILKDIPEGVTVVGKGRILR